MPECATLEHKVGTLEHKCGTLEHKVGTFGHKVGTLEQKAIRKSIPTNVFNPTSPKVQSFGAGLNWNSLIAILDKYHFYLIGSTYRH